MIGGHGNLQGPGIFHGPELLAAPGIFQGAWKFSGPGNFQARWKIPGSWIFPGPLENSRGVLISGQTRCVLLLCWLVSLSGQQLRSPDTSCRQELLFVPAFDKVTSLGRDGIARRNTSVDSFRNSGTAFSVSRTCTSGTKRTR